jgi:hypothetical protein
MSRENLAYKSELKGMTGNLMHAESGLEKQGRGNDLAGEISAISQPIELGQIDPAITKQFASNDPNINADYKQSAMHDAMAGMDKLPDALTGAKVESVELVGVASPEQSTNVSKETDKNMGR